MKKTIWFKEKTAYGWGWYPATWQGWVVTGLFVLYEFSLSLLIGESFNNRAGVTSFVFLTLLGVMALLTICYKYGETPHWHWGNKKKKS